MASLALDPSLSFQVSKEYQEQRVVVEEIAGLIRVYEDGHVERPQIVPSVAPPLVPNGLGVASADVIIEKFTNIWARFYVPTRVGKFPLLIYFHGGGFCVGSASWSCYHEFLARLSVTTNCVVMSVNYRLAPENPLPAAYDDGLTALMWVEQQSLVSGEATDQQWWCSRCDFSSTFLAGDSAGANIAHNVAARLGFEANCTLSSLTLKGTILIQPFFGGELRTRSEVYIEQPARSALTLAASDTYWRLSLPKGSNRDHPWCNPMAEGAMNLEGLVFLPTLVCIAGLDILKDRDLEFCAALARAGKAVEHVVYKGVGHAFQILNKSVLARERTSELICHIKAFITK